MCTTSYPIPGFYHSAVPDGRLVYSTEHGDRRREQAAASPPPPLPNDGVVRVFREKGGRRGKTVTVVRGLPHGELTTVAADLKKLCGAGGAVKEGAVEIQGDHRETVVARLLARGFKAKPAGG
jgi:translation initiation factor 1